MINIHEVNLNMKNCGEKTDGFSDRKTSAICFYLFVGYRGIAPIKLYIKLKILK